MCPASSWWVTIPSPKAQSIWRAQVISMQRWRGEREEVSVTLPDFS